MTDRETHLRKLLACHGSTIGRWPEHEKPFGLDALRQPELALLFDQERQLEDVLASRALPPAAATLADRIILASRGRVQSGESFDWIYAVLAEVRPVAIAATVLLGFAIGFTLLTPAAPRDAMLVQSFSDEGAIL